MRTLGPVTLLLLLSACGGPSSSPEIYSFIGDSLTYHAHWDTRFPTKDVRVHAVPGYETIDVLNHLDPVINEQPSRVFILMGINDLRLHLDKQALINNYRTTLLQFKNRSPYTRVVIQSLLPVDPAQWPIQNSEIGEMNQKLGALAQEFGADYVNLYSLYLDSSGNPNPSLYVDGLHLSEAGYQIWYTKIKGRLGL